MKYFITVLAISLLTCNHTKKNIDSSIDCNAKQIKLDNYTNSFESFKVKIISVVPISNSCDCNKKNYGNYYFCKIVGENKYIQVIDVCSEYVHRKDVVGVLMSNNQKKIKDSLSVSNEVNLTDDEIYLGGIFLQME